MICLDRQIRGATQPATEIAGELRKGTDGVFARVLKRLSNDDRNWHLAIARDDRKLRA